MSTSLNRVMAGNRISYALQILLTLLLLLIPLYGVRAQQGGVGSSRGLPTTSGGNNSIQGRVVFPGNQSGGRRVRVKLESTNFINNSTLTSDDGTFQFNNLENGYYRVTVDDKDYDQTTENVNIDREAGSGRTVQVQIFLQPKGTTAAAFAGVPDESVELYKKGTEAAKKGDSKKAVEHLKKAVEKHPNFALALTELGAQYLRLNDAVKAAEALSNAVKLSPDNFNARLYYGIALLNQKQFAEAEAQLREAVKKNDASSTAHMYLGVALASQKKMDDAQPELERAISIGKDEVAQAHYYLGGILWGKREYKRAADELELYLKLVPKAPNADKLRESIKELRSKQQ
jgi:Flp pilus assembly protein TadD